MKNLRSFVKQIRNYSVFRFEFDAPPTTAFPSDVHFPDVVLMAFGRHFKQLGDKSRLVFDSLYVVPESLAQKALYVSLKLLPSLIRCLLLIHDNDLTFLREDDGHSKTTRRSRSRVFSLTGTV
jgi:hypothetical protein